VPSPPRPPSGKAEAIKLIGGLVVVCSGLLVLIAIGLTAIIVVRNTTSDVVAVATSAFGVLGSVVGAYFGVKIGTDGTQTAIEGLKNEAAKAQAFAAHVDPNDAAKAIALAQKLAGGSGATTPPSGSQPTTGPPSGTSPSGT
jgi:hypothetical protein